MVVKLLQLEFKRVGKGLLLINLPRTLGDIYNNRSKATDKGGGGGGVVPT